MITDQSGHRCLQDGTDVEIQMLGSLFQFVLIVPGHTTHKRYGEVATVIGFDVEAKEILEITHDDSTHTGIVKVS